MSVACIDPQGSLLAQYLDRQSVEKFIGENDDGNFLTGSRWLRGGADRFAYLGLSRIHVTTQRSSDSLAQSSRTFDENVAQRAKKVRKLLSRPIEHVPCEQSPARAQLEDLKLFRRTLGSPHLFELPRQQASENGVYVAGCIKVACLAKRFSIPRIVTKLRMVQAKIHVTGKTHGSTLMNLMLDLLAQRVHVL